jgi:cell wall-associated NlpC family hydrolase
MTGHLRQAVIRLARTAQGIPYIWGGGSPAVGFDCSGFIIWLLQIGGASGPGDWTAQALHDQLRAGCAGIPFAPNPGAVAFYGNSPSHITHCMLCVGDGQVIGASGGGSKNLDRDFSLNNGAKVKQRQLHYRADLIDICNPTYADEN